MWNILHNESIDDGHYPFARVIGGISMSVYVFLRFSFGIQFFKLWSLVTAALTVQSYEQIGLWMGWLERGEWYLFDWFCGSVLALGAVHTWYIYAQERAYEKGQLEHLPHTRNPGTSWLAYLPQLEKWGFNERRKLRWIEPSIVLVLGVLLRPFDPITGTWLLIAAVALVIKNNHTIQQRVSMERKHRDATILSKQVTRRMTPSQPAQQPAHPVRADAHASQKACESHEGQSYEMADTVRQVMGEIGQDSVQDAALGMAGGMVFEAAAELADDGINMAGDDIAAIGEEFFDTDFNAGDA